MALRLVDPELRRGVVVFDGGMCGPNDARRLAVIAGGAAIFVGKTEVASVARVCPYTTGTNNEAEFWGLCLALELAKQYGISDLTVFGDSRLIINFMRKKRMPRPQHLRVWFRRARQLARGFDHIVYRWQRRNTDTSVRADQLAESALAGYGE